MKNILEDKMKEKHSRDGQQKNLADIAICCGKSQLKVKCRHDAETKGKSNFIQTLEKE